MYTLCRSRLCPAAHDQKHRGADRDRTDDLRLAKPALSQLSYSPVSSLRDFNFMSAYNDRSRCVALPAFGHCGNEWKEWKGDAQENLTVRKPPLLNPLFYPPRSISGGP